MGQRGVIGKAAGSKTGKGYNQIRIDRVLHRSNLLAWHYMMGEWPKSLIDHKNRKKDDDRWENLREATRPQNAANSKMRKNNTSGARGVHKTDNKKPFRARITIDGERILLGDFERLEDAATVYAEQSRKHFGEFACV